MTRGTKASLPCYCLLFAAEYTCMYWPILLLTSASFLPTAESPDASGFRLPPGFHIRQVADNRLVPDIYTITFDPNGRLVAAGRGYIRILYDDDGDGRADRAVDFADTPADGAMGLLWESDIVYVVGDGGIRRFRDKDGDGRADGPSELLWPCETGGEHDAHALLRGPDGWLYLLCGNTAGISRRHVTSPASPIKDPVAGCVVRISPDFHQSEIIAHGFRNPYGMDFDATGNLFTCDSDNERCVSLPWYEPVRFYHVVTGRHYGWLSPQIGTFWRYPSHFPDVAKPVCTLGRGSPTGVVCYRQQSFPEKYRNGFFALDWTFGRIWFIKLQRDGASFTARPEIFLQAVGDNGFAPTAAVVDSRTGDLVVGIGGRGTQGGIYRISYQQEQRFVNPKRDAAISPQSKESLLHQALNGQAEVRLAALQAVRRNADHMTSVEVIRLILANAGHADRYVRLAAGDLLERLPETERLRLPDSTQDDLAKATLLLARCLRDPVAQWEHASQILLRSPSDPVLRLTCLRAMQEALGGLVSRDSTGTVWEGYTPRQPPSDSLNLKWFHLFPSGDREVDWELARTLALTGANAPEFVSKLAQTLTDDSDPEADVHYLSVISRVGGERSPEVTRTVARALLALDRKLDDRKANRDRNWPLRIAELHARLAEKDPALNQALLRHPDFGRPDHVIFTTAPGVDRNLAARLVWEKARFDDEYAWSPSLVRLVAELDDDAVRKKLRQLWEQPLLREALLPSLANAPLETDRDLLREALGLPHADAIRLTCEALSRLPISGDSETAFHVLKAWRSLSDPKEELRLRPHFLAVLGRIAGQDHGKELKSWLDWFTGTYPDRSQQLEMSEGVTLEKWQQRLEKLDWSSGNAQRGKSVFQKLGCAACHSGNQAVGPDLRGVTSRFSRSDLLTAIVAPNRDVSPRYQTSILVTNDGRTYRGTIIYEAADGLILQTGPDTTARIATDRIAARRPSRLSLMPEGLLDRSSDQEIADLFQYLKSLNAP